MKTLIEAETPTSAARPAPSKWLMRVRLTSAAEAELAEALDR